MKILATGDIHNDRQLADTLISQAKEQSTDLVVLCGDIGDQLAPPQNIIGPFKDAVPKVLLIPGNHDLFATADFLAQIYGVTNLHGYTAVYDNVAFFGCGGANIGAESLDEQEIFRILKQGHDKITKYRKKILVSHVHPAHTTMDAMALIPGSIGLRKAIEQLQPDIVLCAHAHEGGGIEEKIGKSRIINVSRTGTFIDL